MDRRDFLKTAGAATAATLTATAVSAEMLAAPAINHGARQIILAVPQSLDLIEVRTLVGRLQHQMQTMLPRTSVTTQTTVAGGIEAVSTGFADLYVGIDTQHSSAHAALPVFAGLPLGYDLPAVAHDVWLAGPGRALWAAALDTVDIVAMPVAHTGPSPGLYTDVAFETGADVRDVRVGARGLAADALRLLGADVSDSIVDGIGAVAGRGLTATEPLLAPFEARAQWAYQTGLTPSGLTISLGARGSFWRGLSASDQAQIEGLANAAMADSLASAANRQDTLNHVAAFRRWPMHTAMPVAFERDVRAAVTAAVATLADRDPLARRAIDSHTRLAKNIG